MSKTIPMTILLFILMTGFSMASIHPDFVSLGDYCPDLKIQANYSTVENFTGSIVDGYKAKKAYLSKTAAKALCEVQKEAKKKGVGLKIYDAYRPVKAVQFFMTWAQLPETNPDLKNLYYPKFTREELFQNGYIAKQSSHSRGATVDLTLFNLKDGKDLDMGSGFDYFDDISHTDSKKVTATQRKNRMLLKTLMEGKGFVNYSLEWWHFSYRPEPFPGQSFDFDIE